MSLLVAKFLVLTSIISLSASENLTEHHGNETLPKLDFPCPEAADIAPCVCFYDSGQSKLTLDCTDITSNDELATILAKEFPVNDFYEFRMDSSSYLAALDFSCGGVNFQRFELSPGPFPLVEVSDEFYLTCSSENLEYVKLWNTPLPSLAFPLSPLNDKITFFEMYHSNMELVPAISSGSLTELYLSHGQISEITPGTFDEISNLRELWLYYNNIKILKNGSIPITSNGYFYSIHDNQLETIESGAFTLKGEPQLDSLLIYLHYNLLKTIDASVFEWLMPYINRIDIYGNPLDCGCDLAWIILNPEYMEKATYVNPTCADGTLLTDLDLTPYEQFC